MYSFNEKYMYIFQYMHSCNNRLNNEWWADGGAAGALPPPLAPPRHVLPVCVFGSPLSFPALETTQGQIDGFFRPRPFKWYLPEVASA